MSWEKKEEKGGGGAHKRGGEESITGTRIQASFLQNLNRLICFVGVHTFNVTQS